MNKKSSWKSRICEICQIEYNPTWKLQRTCGRDCGSILRGRIPGGVSKLRPFYTSHCQSCSTLIFSVQPKRALCENPECLKLANRKRGIAQYAKNPERFKTAAHRRRALVNLAFVEDVKLLEVANRDRWICHLCNEPVEKNLKNRNPKMGSLDHVIPISKGGKHSYENTKLSHYECNLIKHNKIDWKSNEPSNSK